MNKEINITAASILGVSNAILGKGPKVDRETYRAHVPQFVSKSGFINQDVVTEFDPDEAINISPNSTLSAYDGYVTQESVLEVSNSIRGRGPKVSKKTYDTHVPDFVSESGFINPGMVITIDPSKVDPSLA